MRGPKSLCEIGFFCLAAALAPGACSGNATSPYRPSNTAGASGSSGQSPTSEGGSLGAAGSSAAANGGSATAATAGAGGASNTAGADAAGGDSDSAGQGGAVDHGGAAGHAGAVGHGGTAGQDSGCSAFRPTFTQKSPTVFILLDRQSAMFAVDPVAQVTPWAAVETGMLKAITELQYTTRFGVGAFTGQTGGACPLFTSVSPAIANASAITSFYQTIGAVSGKTETPTSAALKVVGQALTADASEGSKNILLVSNGQPDFCDDGNPTCALDATVARVQKLAAQGINTAMLDLSSGLSDASLQAIANAGAGLPAAIPFGATSAQLACYSCSGQTGWDAEWTSAGAARDCAATGKQVLGTYSPVGGSAPTYRSDFSDQAALNAQIAGILSSFKSCSFELATQGSLDPNAVGSAVVRIDGQPVPMSTSNGWHLTSPTQLTLVGSACVDWRKPATQAITFEFPCDALLVP